MRNHFDDLITKISKEFDEASKKAFTTNIPKKLEPVSSKDELKKQYWEVDGIRIQLAQAKFSVERKLAEIRVLTKNSDEIRRLLMNNSSEGKMEYIVKATMEYNLNPAFRNSPEMSINMKVDRAKAKLEQFYQSNKKLPNMFDAPIKELDKLLQPLEEQLEWYEKSALTNGVANITSSVWRAGTNLVSKKFNHKNK